MTRNSFLLSAPALMLLAALPAVADDLPRLNPVAVGDLPSVNSVVIEPVRNENIDVTCYLGNPNNRNSLGAITVTSVREAGTKCNELYYPCRGACFGCFSDFGLSENICVDAGGRKFLW